MASVDARAALLSQPAFVLHTRPWRETGVLVEALTAHQGRIGVIARGLSSSRAQPLRAALQPWQFVALTWLPRGELGQLRGAEPLDTAPRLQGGAVLAGFYANELVLRLVPRQDPLPALFRAYAELRLQLGSADSSLAWALRRFERDLLMAIGVGMDLTHAHDGLPVQPDRLYRIDPERGLVAAGDRDEPPLLTGTAALALADDRQPAPRDLSSLRLPMRALLAHHLGPRPLQSWQMAAQLGPG